MLVKKCYKVVERSCISFFKKNETKKEKFKNKKQMILNILIPICYWINNRSNCFLNTYFIGLSGGQGIGKTVFAGLLKIILTKFFNKKVCIISIDDFYKTLNERIKLSKSRHPLFKIRGVPGTHDLYLLLNFLDEVRKGKKKYKMQVNRNYEK